ncbi:MAG: metal-dependent hydrolase [Polyangiales bacterium]
MPIDRAAVRNVRFAIDDERIPRWWHGGRRSLTTFFDNLSVFFPVGERFFIASVRAHGHHVKDERLREDVNLFCGQEGMHGREHERYNELLRARGYPVDAMERRIERILARATRLPRRLRLSATCALEHFTALMAHFLLADERMLAGADETMAALWRWHAAEENEHKAVAYDVYLAAGGHWLERSIVMVFASAIFWFKILEQQVRMMRVDGTASSIREWGALARFLFVSPGGMRRVAGLYFQYFRPSFHPNDIDASALLDAWRRRHRDSPLVADAA